MYCRHCGVGLGPHANYCPLCGTKVLRDKGLRDTEQHVAPVNPQPPESRAHEPRIPFEPNASNITVAEPRNLGARAPAIDAPEPNVLKPHVPASHIPQINAPQPAPSPAPLPSGQKPELGPAPQLESREPSSEPAPASWTPPRAQESADEREVWEDAWLGEDEETAEESQPERRHPLRTFFTFVVVGAVIAFMVLTTLPRVSTSGKTPVAFSTPAALYPNTVASAEVTQQEILDKAAELGISSWNDYTPTFDESTGTLSQASCDQALNLLNLYRFVAGVEPVGLSEAHNAEAQAIVDVYAATSFQAHDITVGSDVIDDATFATAQEAAKLSNVGLGFGDFGKDLPAYIAEVDPNPNQPNYETVGHRRHLLGTSLGSVGFGLNGRYSATYVGDFDGSRAEQTVAWPACQTPLDLWTQGSPWSVSVPYGLEGSEVQVRLTRLNDGRTWEGDDFEHFFVNTETYHDGSAIVFTPRDLTVAAGDVFEVVVEGLPNGGLSYPVEFFSAGIMAPMNTLRVVVQ